MSRTDARPAMRWLDAPEAHDDPATGSSLLRQLRIAPLQHFQAKDILRASGLTLPGADNAPVAHDRQKVHDGKALSPLLPVREPALGRVVVADGEHRPCAAHGLDADAGVPCQIA